MTVLFLCLTAESERLNIVSGIEPHPPVLPSLAPALLVLVLKLLKLVSCSNTLS